MKFYFQSNISICRLYRNEDSLSNTFIKVFKNVLSVSKEQCKPIISREAGDAAIIKIDSFFLILVNSINTNSVIPNLAHRK